MSGDDFDRAFADFMVGREWTKEDDAAVKAMQPRDATLKSIGCISAGSGTLVGRLPKGAVASTESVNWALAEANVMAKQQIVKLMNELKAAQDRISDLIEQNRSQECYIDSLLQKADNRNGPDAISDDVWRRVMRY